MIQSEIPRVAATLRRNGIRPTEISLVSESNESVFRITHDGERYYVKALTEQTWQRSKAALEDASQVGLPESRLLSGERFLLLMDPAAGRPLSRLLLRSFLPGVWWKHAERVKEGMETAGSYIGHLHSRTCDGERKVGNCNERIGRDLTVDTRIRRNLPADTVEILERKFEEVRDVSIPTCRVHGDPTPHNIYVDIGSRETTLIDFSFAPSTPLEDIVHFETGVELMGGRLPYANGSKTAELVQAFHEGYRSTATEIEIPESVYETLKTARYATMLSDYRSSDRLTGQRARITRFIDEPLLKRMIESNL